MNTHVITTSPSVETPKQTRVRKSQAIAMGQLTLSEDFRFRVADDEATISDYAEIYGQYRDDRDEVSKSVRCPLEAITVFCQEDGKFAVVAGRLRFLAAQRAGLETLQCVVITDRDEALRIGLESNRHGLPLTGQDRVRCISIAITRLSGLSNRRIAMMIGCPPSTVDGIVNKYKLRSDAPCVTGLDGKKYRQRKSRKAVAAEPTTAGGPNSSGVANGTTIDETAPAGSERPLKRVLSALGISNSDDPQRLQTYLGIVKEMVADGFKNEKFRQEFLASLRNIKPEPIKK